MKRYRLFVVLLAILLTCGCAAASAATEIPPNPIPLDAPVEEAGILVIPQEADRILENTANIFCKAVDESMGLALTVEKSADPLRDIARGEVKFALCDSGRLSESIGMKTLLTGPFLYGSYEHFTMALNSQTVLSALEEKLYPYGGQPLASFYRGSDFLVASLNLDDFTSFRGMMTEGESVPIPGTIPTVLMRTEDAARQSAYERAGAIVLIEKDPAVRFRLLEEDEAQIVEFSFEETIPDVELWREDLYVTRSWQNTRAVWLLGDKELLSRLDSMNQAILSEAVAALYQWIDDATLAAEEEIYSQAMVSHLQKSLDFTRTRRILSQYARAAELSPGEKEEDLLQYIVDITPS